MLRQARRARAGARCGKLAGLARGRERLLGARPAREPDGRPAVSAALPDQPRQGKWLAGWAVGGEFGGLLALDTKLDSALAVRVSKYLSQFNNASIFPFIYRYASIYPATHPSKYLSIYLSVWAARLDKEAGDHPGGGEGQSISHDVRNGVEGRPRLPAQA